jgi:hypothetical protein
MDISIKEKEIQNNHWKKKKWSRMSVVGGAQDWSWGRKNAPSRLTTDNESVRWAIVNDQTGPRNAHWRKPQLLLRILYVFRLSRIYLRSGALKRNVLSSGYVSFLPFLSSTSALTTNAHHPYLLMYVAVHLY